MKPRKKSTNTAIDFRLDITGEVCPMTFVRARLLTEKMASGQVAEILLKGSEPLENVPRSLRDQGDSVLSLEAIDGETGNAETVHRLMIRKV